VNELARMMVDVFTGTRVGVGSLILIDSVSHLAAVGTAAYTECVVRASKYLMNSFEGKITVRLGVPVLLGGVGEPSLIRSLQDVAAWADGLPSKEQFPSQTRKAFCLSMSNKSNGKALSAEKQILQVPVSILSFEKKTVVSGFKMEIFGAITPFDIEDEKFIISQLVTELNSTYNTDLAADIDFDCVVTAADTDAQPAVIIVGNSQANCLATAMAGLGFKATVVETRPWRPNSMTVDEAKIELAEKIRSTPTLTSIIFWCLDIAAYYSHTEDSILPAVRDVSGKFHIHGSLIVAPSEMFSKSVKQCIPLFTIPMAAKKIVLSPLPRYWHNRCCDDVDHVANIDDADFEGTLFSGLDNLRRIIKDTLFCNGVKDIKILNPSQLCVSVDGGRQTSIDTREALAMWGDDPVHPARDCYESLAEHLVATTSSSTEKPSGSSSASERPLKRPRWLLEDSANTVTPHNSFRGRGRGNQRGSGNRGFRGYSKGGRGRGLY
jgi:hypothetical protein